MCLYVMLCKTLQFTVLLICFMVWWWARADLPGYCVAVVIIVLRLPLHPLLLLWSAQQERWQGNLPPLSPSPRQAMCAQSTDPTVCLLLTQISFYIDLHLSNWLIWWQSIHYRLGKKLSSLDFRRCKICIRLVV